MKKIILILTVILSVGCAKDITHNYTNNSKNLGTIKIVPTKKIIGAIVYVNDQAVVLGSSTKSITIKNIDLDSVSVKVASTYDGYKIKGWNYVYNKETANSSIILVEVPKYSIEHYTNYIYGTLFVNAFLFRYITYPFIISNE